MSDRQQSVKVRVKLSCLIGFIAQYNSLGCTQLLKKSVETKVETLCSDLNWEIRNSMCLNLIKLQKYVNEPEFCFTQLCELVEDEEIETAV